MSGWGELERQSEAVADYIDRLGWSREEQEKLLKMIFIDIGWPKNPLKPGTKVFLIAGPKGKQTLLGNSRLAYAIDGRWYWSDGTAVDGSAMRWEERKS